MIMQYFLKPWGQQMIRIPQGARVLSVRAEQPLVIYAMIDDSRPPVDEVFFVVPTWRDMTNEDVGSWRFVGTVILPEGVRHVFHHVLTTPLQGV